MKIYVQYMPVVALYKSPYYVCAAGDDGGDDVTPNDDKPLIDMARKISLTHYRWLVFCSVRGICEAEGRGKRRSLRGGRGRERGEKSSAAGVIK